MQSKNTSVDIVGSGIGLRRDFIESLSTSIPDEIDFFEVAPENWIDFGGRYRSVFRKIIEGKPIICHGLSLNIGGPAALDFEFLSKLKQFLKEYNIPIYSEHLSYCGDDGHLYDLLPIPFTEEAVRHVSKRIRVVQDMLERKVAFENISYYAAPGQEMQEIDFINAVLEEADCQLLLDVNNIYVNSINHKYDPVAFLHALPKERICYSHVAGHYYESENLRIDTHGSDVIDPVWDLLDKAYNFFGIFPTLLERDFNIPPLPDLVAEMSKIKELQRKYEGKAVSSSTVETQSKRIIVK